MYARVNSISSAMPSEPFQADPVKYTKVPRKARTKAVDNDPMRLLVILNAMTYPPTTVRMEKTAINTWEIE